MVAVFGSALAVTSSANTPPPTPPMTSSSAPILQSQQGRISARPAQKPSTPASAIGVVPLGIERQRDALLFVPSTVKPGQRLGLVVMMHGAGADARQGIDLLRAEAEARGFLLLSPASRDATWDFLISEFGPDVRHLNRALEHVFARYEVDPTRIALGGFSDGASYALSLGTMNGDLFHHLLAFSPGFTAPLYRSGTPRVFVSHGDDDAVLPIDRCSRRLVPALQKAGMDVQYVEFDGGHEVPKKMVALALDRMGLRGIPPR